MQKIAELWCSKGAGHKWEMKEVNEETRQKRQIGCNDEKQWWGHVGYAARLAQRVISPRGWIKGFSPR